MNGFTFTSGTARSEFFNNAKNYSIGHIRISNTDGTYVERGPIFHRDSDFAHTRNVGVPLGSFTPSSGVSNLFSSTTQNLNTATYDSGECYNAEMDAQARNWCEFAEERIRFADDLERQVNEARRQAATALQNAAELERAQSRVRSKKTQTAKIEKIMSSLPGAKQKRPVHKQHSQAKPHHSKPASRTATLNGDKLALDGGYLEEMTLVHNLNTSLRSPKITIRARRALKRTGSAVSAPSVLNNASWSPNISATHSSPTGQMFGSPTTSGSFDSLPRDTRSNLEGDSSDEE
ncbi:hypothetical protein NMY22_g17433 [Coprinellus aureogranulatus]|nr:hypothetical protein NMY22_g17433 [Coprinellus aureogranulatus]